MTFSNREPIVELLFMDEELFLKSILKVQGECASALHLIEVHFSLPESIAHKRYKLAESKNQRIESVLLK